MTREEAINILWMYDVNFEPHPAEEVMHAIDMAIEALRQPERKTGRWIPVTERLPKEDDYKPFSYYEDGAVLFCTKNGKIGFGWYYDSTKEWANEDDEGKDVIAWMPLPEPYKGGEQNDDNGTDRIIEKA